MQDLFLLMVVTLAVSTLLVDLSTMYMAQQDQVRQKELDAEAVRLCDALPSYAKVLHDRHPGLLDRVALDDLTSEDLVSNLRIASAFSITLTTATEQSATPQAEWAWSSGFPSGDRGACVTSVAIWFDDGDVRPARITVWAWRA